MISAEMCVRELGARARDEFSPTGVAEAKIGGGQARSPRDGRARRRSGAGRSRGSGSYAKSWDLSVVRDSTASRLHGDDVAALPRDNRLDVRRPSIESCALLRLAFVFVVSADQFRGQMV